MQYCIISAVWCAKNWCHLKGAARSVFYLVDWDTHRSLFNLLFIYMKFHMSYLNQKRECAEMIFSYMCDNIKYAFLKSFRFHQSNR